MKKILAVLSLALGLTACETAQSPSPVTSRAAVVRGGPPTNPTPFYLSQNAACRAVFDKYRINGGTVTSGTVPAGELAAAGCVNT